MKCPYCDKEMKSGYIRGLAKSNTVWTPEGERETLSGWTVPKNGIELSSYSFGAKKIYMFYCADCKKMIIDLIA